MSDAVSFTVGADEAGARLDVIVADHLGCSRSSAAARIAAGDVEVDATPASKSFRPQAGQQVVVRAPEVAEAIPVTLPPIRYDDEHLLVVAKPAGLVVHPGSGRPSGTLVDALREAGIEVAGGDPRRPGIVHRLDRETSGLLVVARSQQAYDGLVEALAARMVHRRYLALVEGDPPKRGRVDAPIGRDPRVRTRFAAVADGKRAVTRFHVLGAGHAPTDPPRAVTLLEVLLETGRTHQIRVHLSFAGHPVVGDETYGATVADTAALGLARPFLHAARLGFTHPVTGAAVEVDEPLPADLAAALDIAGIATPGSAQPWPEDAEDPEDTDRAG